MFVGPVAVVVVVVVVVAVVVVVVLFVIGDSTRLLVFLGVLLRLSL